MKLVHTGTFAFLAPRDESGNAVVRVVERLGRGDHLIEGLGTACLLLEQLLVPIENPVVDVVRQGVDRSSGCVAKVIAAWEKSAKS